MLSASVLGEVFTSPDTDSIVASIKEVAGKRGALPFDELHGYLCDLQDDFTRSCGLSTLCGEQAESQEAEQPVFIYFSLEVIDQIGYRSLLRGFPSMTLGPLSGSVLAVSTYESLDFLDPKILLSLLMWAVYMVMVFTRWNSGWRGRPAVFLATFPFVAAIVGRFVNYFSAMHRFAAS